MEGTYTVNTFCAFHNLSRATFYTLLQRGEGPKIMKVGRRTLVSTESAAEWRRRMEQRTAQHIEPGS